MRTLLAAVLAAALAACGDKVPESEAARKAGRAPKQAVDRAATEVNQALKQGAERTREADRKQ